MSRQATLSHHSITHPNLPAGKLMADKDDRLCDPVVAKGDSTEFSLSLSLSRHSCSCNMDVVLNYSTKADY